MTIKEFCKCNDCCTCVFFPICVWNDKKPLKWDKLTITAITNAIIETSRKLLEDISK